MKLLFGSSMLAIALVSNTAWAQDVEPAVSGGEAVDSSPIIVTGSRVVRSTFNSPTPVNVVGADRLEKTGISNIGDALNQLPSFRQVTSPATNLYRQSTNTAARTMDLRGLGDSRTLVLVDGRRFVPSSELGTVDLNAIPSSLVKRVEVVTGGASAAYGANAVAGVVNIILDTTYEGLKGSASYGVTEFGDASTYEVTGAYGTSFADGRGHLVVGGELVDEKTAGDPFSRPWTAGSTNLLTNPDFDVVNQVSLNGLPRTLLLDNVVLIHSEGGVIRTGPLAGTKFNAITGLPEPLVYGDLVSGILMVGGDPDIYQSFLTEGVPLKAANRHLSLFGHTTYEVNDGLEVFAELSYAKVRGGPTRGSDSFSFGVPIQIDNPFMPEETRMAAVDAGVTSISVSKLFREIGHTDGISMNNTYRGVLGARGDLTDTWSWDAYYQYGQTSGRLDIYNLRNNERFGLAVDAVEAPGGEIACRSTLTDSGNGCVPYNVFGANAGSLAAVNYVTGNAYATRKITQHAMAFNVNGDLFDGWAGPIAAAAGAEYRRDRSSGTADAISSANGWNSNNAFPLPPGGDNTIEGYVEVSVPLLSGSAMGDATLDGAVRQTHTRDTGNSTTWKLGFVYEPINDLMVRVTRSHDIRAPSELELSTISNTINLPVNDPEGNNGTYLVNITSGGNPTLSNEVGDTLTAGLVFTPGFFPGFRFSVDYFDIKVKKAVSILSGQSTINICKDGNTALCNFVIRGSDGLISEVVATYQNLGQLRSEGLEFVGDYSIPLGAGDLSFMAHATYMMNLTTTDALGFETRYDGWTGNPGTVQSVFGVPKWRGDALINYSDDQISVSAHGRYVGSGAYDLTRVGPNDPGYDVNRLDSINYNDVESRLYWDLSASYDIFADSDRKVEVFGSIYNVFDKEPPRLRLYGNPVLFDVLGRRYKIGIRAEY